MRKEISYIHEDMETELFFKKVLNFVLLMCGVLLIYENKGTKRTIKKM